MLILMNQLDLVRKNGIGKLRGEKFTEFGEIKSDSPEKMTKGSL